MARRVQHTAAMTLLIAFAAIETACFLMLVSDSPGRYPTGFVWQAAPRRA